MYLLVLYWMLSYKIVVREKKVINFLFFFLFLFSFMNLILIFFVFGLKQKCDIMSHIIVTQITKYNKDMTPITRLLYML